jgi:hypothetical protein
MRLTGWKSWSMLDRYGADMAQQQAIDASLGPQPGRPEAGVRPRRQSYRTGR